MKQFAILALVCVALFSTCGNDDDGDGGGGGDCQEGCLQFTIDGNSFSTDAATATLSDFSAAKTLTLGNFGSPNFSEISTISIAVAQPITLEEISYNLGPDCDTAVSICVILTYAEVNVADPGNSIAYSSEGIGLDITFSKVDFVSGGVVAGTFSGEVGNIDDPSDRRIVSNGSFNVSID